MIVNSGYLTALKEAKMRWFFLALWTVVMIVGGSDAVSDLNQDISCSGTNLEFEAGEDRFLDLSQEVGFEAASNGFFVLRKESGEALVAVPAEPPLGWKEETYFTAGPVTISAGRWMIEKGRLTVHLTSDQVIEVVLVRTPDFRGDLNFATFLVSLMIWLIGVVIIWQIFESF